MNKSNGVVFAILSGVVLMTMGVAATPVLAGGSHDHHSHNNSKHCEKNGDNSVKLKMKMTTTAMITQMKIHYRAITTYRTSTTPS